MIKSFENKYSILTFSILIIKDHLKSEKKRIIERLGILAKRHPKPAKISLNIYSIIMPINYPSIKNILSSKLDNL